MRDAQRFHFKRYKKNGMLNASIFDDIEKRIKYGYLYNWYTIQGVGVNSITSSDSWVIPSHTQATTFFNYINSPTGNKIKEIGSTYWGSNPTNGGTNELNFSARASGYGVVPFSAGRPGNPNGSTYFFMWVNNLAAMVIQHENTSSILEITAENTYTNYKHYGMAVRLVRPATAQDPPNDGGYCDKYPGNDGQKYLTVRIGNQVWTAENLAETKYRGGTEIANVTDSTQWSTITSGARAAYGNDEENVKMP